MTNQTHSEQASQPLLLASSSRYRRGLLERLGLPFNCASPDIDESPEPAEPPPTLVQRLSQEKAHALASAYPDHLIIGSDQVASCGEQVLGKPGTVERAQTQLALLSGQTVDFLTGLALLNTRTGHLQVDLDRTRVRFRRLATDEIAAYVGREQPLDCAGSFKSEGLGVTLFDAIETTDPSALIGLPLIKLCTMLRQEELDPLLR